tara:strand:- start:294 stop:1142 length:849 start_codon:yes stop_codon:yes gene_type:complete
MNSYLALVKPKLSLMSVVSVLFGYAIAQTTWDWSVFLYLFVGTFFTAAGASAVNQWIEIEEDKLMDRTRNRPLPSGDLKPINALVFGIALCLIGFFLLWTKVGHLSSYLVLVTMVLYLFVYTPLKKITPWSTEVGAIPGALPPLVGWAAAEGTISFFGWVLFGVLFAWQMPHFMAISYRFKDDYRKAGFAMRVLLDNGYRSASKSSLFYTIVLILVTYVPIQMSWVGSYYMVLYVCLNSFFLYKTIIFYKAKDKDDSARGLFSASILYLPLILFAMIVDRFV